MIAKIRFVIAIVLILMLTLIFVPLLLICKVLKLSWAQKIPRWWYKCALWLMGVRVNIHGRLSNAHPLLLVCNHVSWVDILVMGSIGDLCFIAKAEIKSWPVINGLAKLVGTVFVDRKRSRDAANQADTIAARLLHGDVMVLFAEGTTGDGNQVLGFKSSLFGAAQYAIRQSHIDQVIVQPVAICYTRLHGIRLGRRHQPLASWPGNVGLAEHLIQFVTKSAFDVDVVMGEPLEFTATTNRKHISKAANQQVATLFSQTMRNNLK